MKIKEIRELTTSEIKERLDAETARLTSLKISHSISPLDNPSQIKALRHDIAKFNTELRQRELQTK
jgi:large subunit ribosomal protein L29